MEKKEIKEFHKELMTKGIKEKREKKVQFQKFVFLLSCIKD